MPGASFWLLLLLVPLAAVSLLPLARGLPGLLGLLLPLLSASAAGTNRAAYTARALAATPPSTFNFLTAPDSAPCSSSHSNKASVENKDVVQRQASQ
jgi:hypothetical protein